MTIHSGDCHNILITLPRETFDAMITDPPYGLLEKKQTNDRTVCWKRNKQMIENLKHSSL